MSLRERSDAATDSRSKVLSPVAVATMTSETRWTIRQLALLGAWCVIVFCSSTLYVIADVFLEDAPVFPLVPTVVVAACTAAAAAYTSALFGMCLHPSRTFRLYQPFAGGARFVAMQAFGYYILTTSQVVVVGFVSTVNHRTADGGPMYGLMSIAGSAALVANVMLMGSVFIFNPHEAKGQLGKKDKGLMVQLLHNVSKSPNRETTLVTIFIVAQIGLCGVGEVLPIIGSVSAFVVSMFHIINGCVIHFVIGYRFTPHYRLFMPCPGTALQALSQCTAWLVYFVTLYGAGFLWFVGEAAPPLAHVALGSGCLLSSVGLILFTRLTNFRPSGETTHDSLASYGCVVLTATSALQAAIIVLLTAFFMLYSPIDPSIRLGLEFCQTLSSYFILVIPVCTHVVGHVIHGASFRLFQPFKGGVDFVMLQAAGWACFGFSLLFQTLQMSSGPNTYRCIFVEAVLALMAQVLVHSSLRTFRADSEDDTQLSICERMPEGLRSVLSVMINGELITAFLCSACALALRVVVDVAELRWDPVQFPRETLLVLAAIMFALATPIAHVSGRHHGIPLFRPFDGSGMYVALQSIGWTIYALSLLVILFSWVIRGDHGYVNVSATLAGGGAVPTFSSFGAPRPMFLATFYGVVQFIPLLLVAISVVVESMQLFRGNRNKGFATQAFEAIIRAEQVLLKAEQSTDEQRKAELDMLICELRSTSVSLRSASPARERLPLAPATNDGMEALSSPEDDTRHLAATLIVVLMSLASLSTYVVGSFWTSVMPVYGVGFATVALAIVTTSCVALHAGYGYTLHGATGRYTFFMPFVGGTPFVMLQALGWMSYTVCAVLTIACAIERRSNPVALILAGVASAVAQFALLASIPRFDGTLTAKRSTFFQNNSAALVATFTFLGSFVFAHLYVRFRDETFGSAGDGDEDSTQRIARAHMVPLVVSGVSMTFAIPLTLVALRSRMNHRLLQGSDTSDGGDDDSGKPIPFRRRILRDVLVAVDSIVFALSLSIPAAVLYIGYFLLHNFSQSSKVLINLSVIAQTWGHVMLVLGCLLAFSLTFPVLTTGGVDYTLPERARRWREAFVTFQLYLIPTHASLLSYSMPLIFPGSWAAMYFAVAMSFLTVAAHVKIVRTLVLRFSYVLLGYTAYQHCRDYWESPSMASTHVLGLVTDVLLLVFWVKYESLFRNKPQETGSLRSPWFVSMVERYIIPDIERYFNMKLVLDGHPVEEAQRGSRKSCVPSAAGATTPCLCNPENQYIFSYHPHGVFPGTALFLPFTEQWRFQLGWNTVHCVTVHAAGIIFNVPMVRDFLLRLGGRVVTRTSLDISLEQGNSVMIVTGGQAEMLHTRYSRTEMHLVTHHHGFLKLAVKHQVPVVPLVCFAEHNVMDNVHVPWLQKKMLKLIGFPFPTVPHGRWFLPLPNRTPLTVVVGRPVNPPDGLCADDKVGIQQFADAYFAEVKRIFYAHRVACGYPEMELVLHGKHED